jgi:hypothetical protein
MPGPQDAARYTMQRSALEGRRGVQGVARTLRRDGDAGLLLSVRFTSTLSCCFDLAEGLTSRGGFRQGCPW